MTANLSRGGTAGVKALADRALLSAEGIKVTTSKAEVYRLRQLFHSMRFYERKVSRKERNPDDPLYDASVYDCLETVVSHDGETWTLIFRTISAGLGGLTITDLDTNQPINKEDL